VSVQQAPWHGGAFNDKDCTNITTNLDLIFDLLGDIETRDTSLEMILMDHSEQWEAFGDVVPLVRSIRELTGIERNDVHRTTTRFEDTYKKKSKENISMKMHWMVKHIQQQLNMYHTVGLFAKYSMESINAIVNILSRVFCWVA
jgi:hypothetical protein